MYVILSQPSVPYWDRRFSKITLQFIHGSKFCSVLRTITYLSSFHGPTAPDIVKMRLTPLILRHRRLYLELPTYPEGTRPVTYSFVGRMSYPLVGPWDRAHRCDSYVSSSLLRLDTHLNSRINTRKRKENSAWVVEPASTSFIQTEINKYYEERGLSPSSAEKS